MRKLIAGFATSIDGFIEGPNGEIDWIIYDKEQFKELAVYWKRMDAMFYGRKTYEAALAMRKSSDYPAEMKKSNPFGHMKHYVFSKTLKKVEKDYVLVSGDLKKEVNKIKSEPGKEIAVFGGGVLVCALLNLGLVDELTLAISPVLLGKGRPFFPDIKKRIDFTVKEVKSYSSGLVSLTYSVKNK